MNGLTRFSVVALVCLSAGAGLAAAPAWLGKIRRDHPRMFFNKDTWPQLVERSKGPAAEARERLIARCDSYPDNPVCTGTGKPVDREGLTVDSAHTGIPPINEWGTQAAECALAWRFTGDRKYLEKAKAMLRANVKGYDEAIANLRAVNWYSHTRLNSLCAYDWIYNDLTDQERREIIVPLVNHVEAVQPRPGRPSIRRRNTGGVTAGCYGVKNLMWYAGLAAYGDGYCDKLAAQLIVEGQDYHAQVLKFRSDSAGDDGALGTGTPGYAMGHYPWGHFNVFHCWLSAIGENLADRYPAMALYPNWVWWMWIPNPDNPEAPMFHGYGDAYHTLNQLPIGCMYEHMVQYNHFFAKTDPVAARLAAAIGEMCPNRRVGGTFPAYPFLFGKDESVKPYTKEDLRKAPLKSRHFEQLGQVFMRSGWKEDSTYALFVGGTLTPMHKHHDEGHFAIFKHDFLALDTGDRAAQTDWNLKYYYSQSVAHNVVLIQKPGESLPNGWGPRYDGPEGKTNYGGMYGCTSKIVAYETNPQYSYVAADATKLYGDKCTECVRQFIHLQPDYFIVYDRVGASNPDYAKQWLLHSQNEPVVEGRLARADSRKGRLFCETLLPKDAQLVKIGGPGKEFWANGKNWEFYPKWRQSEENLAKRVGRGPYWGAWRLETHPGAPRKDDRFLHVLTATDVSHDKPVEARPCDDRAHDGVTVILPDQTLRGEKVTLEVTVLFNRTGKVGGEIRFLARNAAGAKVAERKRPLTDEVMKQAGVIME